MEWFNIGENTRNIIRKTVFRLFFLLLLVFAADQWVDLEKVGANLTDSAGLWSGLSRVFILLGTQKEVLFLLTLICGISAILLVKNKHNVQPLSLARQVNEKGTTQRSKTGAGFIGLLVVGFIVIRAGMLFVYDGSYIDEYWHVFSGQELLKDGTFTSFYENGETYTRGSVISLLVGISVTVFGAQVWAIKLVPVLISVGSLILLIVIGYHVFRTNSMIVLMLLFYTFSPWLLFQHFYARMYVFYEFFILLLLVITFRVIAALQSRKSRTAALWSALLFGLPLGAYVAVDDKGAFLPLIMSGIVAVYLILFEIQHLFVLEKSKNPKEKMNATQSYPRLLLLYKLIFILIFGTIAFGMFNIREQVRYLVGADLTHTSPEGFKYINFFFDIHPLFTIFFLLSPLVLMLPSRERIYATVTLVAGFFLFLVHMASSADLQIVRGVIYFLPLFFIVTLITVEQFQKHVLIALGVPLLLMVNIIGSYPDQFFQQPHIPGEVFYIDYHKAYAYVKEQCRSEPILQTAPSPFIAQFYDVTPDYGLMMRDTRHQKSLYVSAREDETVSTRMKSYYGRIPMLTDRARFTELLQEPYCYVERHPSRYAFISQKDHQKLVENADETETFQNISVYINRE
jgi:hypothetical protein